MVLQSSVSTNCAAAIEYLPWPSNIMNNIPQQDASGNGSRNRNLSKIYSTFSSAYRNNDTSPEELECLMQEIMERGLPLAKKITLAVGVIAVIANLCSLLAIWNINKKLTANLRLILSLCLSDTLVAITVIVNSSTKLVPFRENTTSNNSACMEEVVRAVRMAAHIESLFNLLGLGLDHYYAIVRTLHYRMVMSKKKVTWAIIISWIVSFILGFTDFFMPSEMHEHCEDAWHDICSRAACTTYDSRLLAFTMTMITLLILLVLYTSIFITLRRKHSELHRHKVVMKSKKQGMITTMFILATFMLFWLPHFLFEFSHLIIITGDLSVEDWVHLLQRYTLGNYYLYCVLLLNSLSDPVIYAWRMREVQRGYRNLIAKITCLRYKHVRLTTTHLTRHHSLDSLLQLRLKKNGKGDLQKYPCRYYSQYNTNALPINGITCTYRYPSPRSLLRSNGYLPLQSTEPLSPIQIRRSSLTDISNGGGNYWDKIPTHLQRKSCCPEMLRQTHRFNLIKDLEILRLNHFHNHHQQDSQDDTEAGEDTLEEEHSLCSTPPSCHNQQEDKHDTEEDHSSHSGHHRQEYDHSQHQTTDRVLGEDDLTVTSGADTQCLISYIDLTPSFNCQNRETLSPKSTTVTHYQDSLVREHSKSYSDILESSAVKLRPSSQLPHNQQPNLCTFSSDSKISYSPSALPHRNTPIQL